MKGKIVTAGIVLDDHKVERFTKVLSKKGFAVKDSTPFSKEEKTTIMRVEVDAKNLSNLHTILRLLEGEQRGKN